MTFNETVTTTRISFIQEQKLISKNFSKIEQSTLTWSTIALACITCLIFIYIGIKTFTIHKKRQIRRYKLLNSSTTIEEPLFNGHDNDEEENDDGTLLVRK
ncbi:unnamed protein product [Rotaria sordida]|uniref:Uncharacterized protein n=1 Tax=Rotaria sordida TaxID=392033 RepID=A0A815LN92_9BILA|nr:unnamed protein product [Rotaria sordida]